METINQFLESLRGQLTGWITLLPVGYAFGAGMLATINPCGFAMLPAFVGFYTGRAGEARGQSALNRAGRGLFLGLAVSVGFVAVFAAAGAVSASGGRLLVDVVPWVAVVIGAGLVVLGIYRLSGRSVGLLAASRIALPSGHGAPALFLFGIAYAGASLSCTLPIFLAVVGTSITRAGAAEAFSQFISYALGMSLVMVLLTVSMGLLRETLVRSMRAAMPQVERLSALLLVVAGAYIVYYWLRAGVLT